MEERARSCLLRSRMTLEEDIKASYLIDHMISDGVLTGDEEDRIRSKPTRKEKAAALLEVLLCKDNRAYISFYNALIRESYGDLATLLHGDLPQLSPEGDKSYTNGISSSVQMILSEGGVPQRPMVFVNRPSLLSQLREKLRHLQKAPGWVTVHGMAGSGKSVIAAEAVRDRVLINECFPDGVHWLSIGQCDKADLLVRMQSLCFRLEQSQSSETSLRTPGSVEEAKERLRFLMLRRLPRSLLILDDVWDSFTLRAFDIQCRVLLTTRISTLTDAVSGHRFKVSVESGLDEEKALEILALYVNGKAQTLPEQARCIVEECKGSPLVVSLIGALLRDFPDRWGYYLEQLKKKKFQRIRKSSSYDYEALDQAMDASLQVLEEEHRELYKDLSVLEKDVKVPAKVLSVVWGLELEEVEDVLQEFVNKSLMFRDCNQRPYLYFLHDLQLDFLTEQNRNQLAELHAKVVCQYQKAYQKMPPLSGDVEGLYWYRFLAHHMARAGMSKELSFLMFSLDWVKNKAQVMGSAHLINDYAEYGDILDKENNEVRQQFQEFLSLNGHQLEQRPFPDVVQLALAQPHSSEVYRQGLMQARERASRGQLYLDWVNKSSLESMSRLVLHPNQNSVHFACFSRDGSKIASCGASKTLRVFKSTSGEKIQEIQDFDDEVLCCAFSPDDRQIATCSSDRKVKIWNLEKGTLVRVFNVEHDEQINHCQFTNKNRRILLATCSNDKFTNTKVWNMNKQTSQNTMFGHMDGVNHCCFSPDDAYLATSSNDGTLKLFEVTSANEWKSIDITSLFPESDEGSVCVKCSTWSADGQRIIGAAKNTVFVFDVATLDLVLEIRASRLSTVQYCHACPNSQLLALALSHYTVELWDFEANKKMAECSGHLSWVPCVQFSPDGSLLLSASDDHMIRLWETERVHTSSAVALKRDFDVLFSQEGITVVAADSRNCLQLWDFEANKKMAECSGHLSWVPCVQFSPDGSLLLSASDDHMIRLWETERVYTSSAVALKRDFDVLFSQEDITVVAADSRNCLQVCSGPEGKVLLETARQEQRIRCVCICKQTSTVALGMEDGSVRVLEVPSGNVLATLQGHTKTVHHCLFTDDGQTLITASEDSTIRVWRWRTGQYLELKGHKEQVRRFQLLNSSSALLSWSFDGTVKVWDLKSGEKLQDLQCHQGAVLSGDVSPDGLLFSTTSADKTVKVWSCSSWKMVFFLEGHKACVRSCRFSGDNKRLATGDDNGEIRLWNMLNGKLLKICSRESKDSMDSFHGGWVTDLHFSPDSKVLVSTGGYIKWWSVDKGEALQTFYTTGNNLKRICVSPDFKTFITIDNIGILYVLKQVERRWTV
ncbi:apoptotic protease-activating factor 1 isoform X1 [Silurus asotus]|uniref:Apoptotic protease-activating factor 1 n=1 Tax=Silurus asotus TaxID=30991 RepID=A0AAD5AET9_SILAS|nr:apoptotic protease-activating factor 1 isoform X1 [Silurus asotus]